MRILMISAAPIRKNGITSVITNIVSSIDDTNIRFDLVCPNTPDSSYYSLFEQKGGEIYKINREVRHPFAYIKKLSELIRMNKYDVIHAHGNSSSLLMEMTAGILGGARIRIAHSHNTTCSELKLHRLLNPIFQRTYNYALACGQDAGKWLYGKRHFDVIKNGIDVNRFAFCRKERERLRTELDFSQDDFVIGHIGVMNNQKNHLFLLRIFSTLCRDYPNAKLMLVGDGQKRPEIEQFIAAHNLNNKIVLTGNVNNIGAYLSAIDLIVMPSLYEGLPVALIEEQANGLVCVVSDSITREVNLSGNVIFISLDNEDEWKQKILQQYEINSVNQRDERSVVAIQKIIESGYSIKDEAEKLRDLYYTLDNQLKKY